MSTTKRLTSAAALTVALASQAYADTPLTTYAESHSLGTCR